MSNVREIAVTAQAPLDIQKPQMRVYGNSASLTDVISRAASDPAMDVQKLQALLDMHERLRAKEAEQQFDAAMAETQAEMRPISADADNPQTKSKYASYAQLDKALRLIYTTHGFALSFDTGATAPENCVNVTCRVSHRDGHARMYHVVMPADGKGAKGGDVMTRTHATGAALSYGARYLLKLIFNVAVGESDDDGNSASLPPAKSNSLSDQQMVHLRDMIDRTKTNVELFCKHFRVEALPDLSTKDYVRAVEMLTQKMNRAKP